MRRLVGNIDVGVVVASSRTTLKNSLFISELYLGFTYTISCDNFRNFLPIFSISVIFVEVPSGLFTHTFDPLHIYSRPITTCHRQ